MKKARNIQGFTLIELLVVITIIGVLAGAFSMVGLRSWRAQQLREAAAQLAADLGRARSLAQRTSQDSEVALVSSSASSPNGGYSVTLSGAKRDLTLPNGALVAPYASTTPNKARFTAPYAELGNTVGVVWVVSSPNTSNRLYVKLVGVTGKVILSATY